MFCFILFYSVKCYSILLSSILFILFRSNLLWPVSFYSALLNFILFYCVLVYSILFYSGLIYSVLFLFCSILPYTIRCCSIQFDSVVSAIRVVWPGVRMAIVRRGANGRNWLATNTKRVNERRANACSGRWQPMAGLHGGNWGCGRQVSDRLGLTTASPALISLRSDSLQNQRSVGFTNLIEKFVRFEKHGLQKT